MRLTHLVYKSLQHRRTIVLLTVFTIAISVFVLLGTQHLRQQVRVSFDKAVSQVDVIVGAPTGQLNLLLYSLFHIGQVSRPVPWSAYQAVSDDPTVAWSVPITLGDSHYQFNVVGTTTDFFSHYHYGQQQSLALAKGELFQNTFDAVIGAEVAQQRDYQLGDELIFAHGHHHHQFNEHDEDPFTVRGILQPTGTVVDKTIYVRLKGLEAVHTEWKNIAIDKATYLKQLEPTKISAFLVGLHAKNNLFSFQYRMNNHEKFRLQAILPGVALTELWQIMGYVENTLLITSALVLLSSLLGMNTMLLASMQFRKKELALMRLIGAHPRFLFIYIQCEALLITCAGIGIGLLSLWIALHLSQPILAASFSLFIDTNLLSATNGLIMALIIVTNSILTLIPSIQAYRTSLLQSATS
ncbi:MAG: ABC transporter permease [Shewanellaceae bacterium]|nr:ABC transporter permease [Shewanellaceae bacterium]